MITYPVSHGTYGISELIVFVTVLANFSFSNEFNIFTRIMRQMTKSPIDKNNRISPMTESDNPVSANRYPQAYLTVLVSLVNLKSSK